MVDSTRAPAVAGLFYPADPAELAHEVHAALGDAAAGEPAIAVVVPHAGYVYSGAVAGATFARVRVPRRVIVLAVNHRGRGAPVASWARGSWRTPLGEVEIDRALIEAVTARAPFVVHDPAAHEGEHSLEVQLPFLQLRGPVDLQVPPISIASHDVERLTLLGEAVAGAVAELGEPALVVASTDMTHYETVALARTKDEMALEHVRAVDGPALLATVLAEEISMCGVAPTTAALVAARALGARQAELVRYATSGDVTGDRSSVVAYAGLVVR